MKSPEGAGSPDGPKTLRAQSKNFAPIKQSKPKAWQIDGSSEFHGKAGSQLSSAQKNVIPEVVGGSSSSEESKVPASVQERSAEQEEDYAETQPFETSDHSKAKDLAGSERSSSRHTEEEDSVWASGEAIF